MTKVPQVPFSEATSRPGSRPSTGFFTQEKGDEWSKRRIQ